MAMIRPSRGRVQERERVGHILADLEEREATTRLGEKENLFPFPYRCYLSFYVFSRFPISCRIRISTLSIYLYLVILI